MRDKIDVFMGRMMSCVFFATLALAALTYFGGEIEAAQSYLVAAVCAGGVWITTRED